MTGLDKFKITKEKEDNYQGVFKIGPLPKGYGITLSNSLRRILLSSIPGAAVTAIKIDGIKHEYSTMEGLHEDIITLILKLKELSIRLFTEEKRVIKLNIKGKKNSVLTIKAADFDLPGDIEIVNPDLEIASLTSDLNLKMEITVEPGVGYAYPNEEVREEMGMIPIDSIFSPVKTVKVEVTKTRVGKDTNLDQIELTIVTNGTIKPSEALLKSAEIYDSLANRLVDTLGGDSAMLKEISASEQVEEVKEEKKILIGELNLSTRLNNALLNAGITNLNDLGKYKTDEVANFRGMGKKSLSELQEVMGTHNINFQ